MGLPVHRRFWGSERQFRLIRWILLLGWLALIASLFYDPISSAWTASDSGSIWAEPVREHCVRVQNICLLEAPYAIGNRLFWGMVIPSAIWIVLALGHEVWRRICPLYFVSQLPRALGIKPLLQVHQNLWLQRNHFYLQFAYFFVGLNVRILLVNANRIALGCWLLLTMGLAIATNLIYGGRSWCHYICPFGMVQTVFTGPRGLLGSKAHTAPTGSLTQSMCRTVPERSTCIGCKSTCFDIDSEKSYWEDLQQPGRRLVQYGYLGLVLGYIAYYLLYAGNTEYYFSGAWTHEPYEWANLLKPGFYIAGQTINVPKLVAAPLTLAVFAGFGYSFGSYLELFCRQQLQQQARQSVQQQPPLRESQEGRHRVFSLCTFLAFNLFFVYGGRPELRRLPAAVELAIQALITTVSVLWLVRVWHCSPERYAQESIADKLRRQLRKLPLNLEAFLGDRDLDSLTPAEVQILATTLPAATQQDRQTIYRGVLRDALATGLVHSQSSLKLLHQLRGSLSVEESLHEQFLQELAQLDGSNPNQTQFPFAHGQVIAASTPNAQGPAFQPLQTSIPRTIVRRANSSEHPPLEHQPTQMRPKPNNIDSP